jgi:hypothetical protein
MGRILVRGKTRQPPSCPRSAERITTSYSLSGAAISSSRGLSA